MEVTYKQVLDREGFLTGLELWQDGKFITISFSVKGTHPNYYRWEEIKVVVDKLAQKAFDEVNARTKDMV